MILIRVLVMAILVSDVIPFMKKKVQTLNKYEALCKTLLSFANFEDTKVIGRFWTIYFTWNSNDVENSCMDISFKRVNGEIINRFQKSMQKYLQPKPAWNNATLLMTLNMTRNMTHKIQEILFFPDPLDAVGRFFGLPNIRLLEGILDITTYRYVLKLTRRGRYLLLSNCQTGTTFFSVRRDHKHTWKEIDAAVKTFDYNGDPGFPTCKYSLRKKRRRPHRS